MAPDYSLYLVTDSSKAILGDRDLVDVVSKAIDGGEYFSYMKAQLGLTIYRCDDRAVPRQEERHWRTDPCSDTVARCHEA